ncbi:hypothetical protein ACLOJK_036009 [Asimina triloba]
MGNCQAAEAATVVIQSPGGMIQRIYWSVSANEVMASNPGHYVAVVAVSGSDSGAPVKHLKLLRPDDTLHIGHVYRLVSFEGILKEFAGKRLTKLSRAMSTPQLQQRGGEKEKGGRGIFRAGDSPKQVVEQEQEGEKVQREGRSNGRAGASRHQNRQWKPALQSIAEVGS